MAHKHTHTCAVASALNVFGDRWTLLIIREAFYGATRFGEFLKNTGISKNLLADRLGKLVDEGILEHVEFSDRGTSHAYQLTEKGRALDVVMIAIQQWADKHLYGEGHEPVLCFDRKRHAPLPDVALKDARGKVISFSDLTVEPGPGADGRTKKRIAQANLDA